MRFFSKKNIMCNLLTSVILNISEGTSDNLIFFNAVKDFSHTDLGFGQSLTFILNHKQILNLHFILWRSKTDLNLPNLLTDGLKIHSFISVRVRWPTTCYKTSEYQSHPVKLCKY